jgi:ABC-type polar amino acid transport system ATPase subunit
MLIAKNITKKFGEKVVLDDISLEIKPGTITSIIGSSGSGKTTLLRTLALLEFADSGKIEIDNSKYSFPLENIEGKEPWPNLTIVFQSLFIWPHLTLRENILLPLGKNISNDDIAHLEELIDLFSMKQFLDRYPNEVSLGQKQRTALVRALVLRPKYLLLDEITSSLDVEQIGIILSHLDVIKKQGVGIIMATHLINFARTASDTIIFLDQGKIVEIGNRDILTTTTNGRLKQFIKMVEQAS